MNDIFTIKANHFEPELLFVKCRTLDGQSYAIHLRCFLNEKAGHSRKNCIL